MPFVFSSKMKFDKISSNCCLLKMHAAQSTHLIDFVPSITAIIHAAKSVNCNFFVNLDAITCIGGFCILF